MEIAQENEYQLQRKVLSFQSRCTYLFYFFLAAVHIFLNSQFYQVSELVSQVEISTKLTLQHK